MQYGPGWQRVSFGALKGGRHSGPGRAAPDDVGWLALQASGG